MPGDRPERAGKGANDVGEEISWQAQKSAMTRDKILEAAVDCFIHLGYTNVTTAKVASAAGVSRGAMLHHFPSKTELIQAATEYLHGKLLEDFTSRVRKIPTLFTFVSSTLPNTSCLSTGNICSFPFTPVSSASLPL